METEVLGYACAFNLWSRMLLPFAPDDWIMNRNLTIIIFMYMQMYQT